jgi:hypothetical protein
MHDTTFIEYLLTFLIGAVILLYMFQSLPKTNKILLNNYKNKSNTNSMYPIILDTCKKGHGHHMPVHRVGPVHNFHQHFNKYNPSLTVQHPSSIPQPNQTIEDKNGLAYPTGIPELGWRNYYLANFSENQVPYQDPFAGTPIRTFLNNMENVQNIYREC